MTRREIYTLEDPLDDLYEALEALVEKTHRSGGYLCLLYRKRGLKSSYRGPRIVRQHMGGYAEMEVTGEDIYFLTERLAEVLAQDGYTRGTPKWGYTEQSERHASDYGEREYYRMWRERENLLEKAIELAASMHAGQLDKAGAPYIEHPLRVAERLRRDDIEGRIVAVLHDVLEDTPVTTAELAAIGLSEKLIKALQAITHAPDESNEDYWARVRANRIARRVKRADIADNLDEKRLEKLPPETADRLRAKYKLAREAIGD